MMLSFSVCPGKAKHRDAPGVLLTWGPQLSSCFLPLNEETRKIYPQRINPSNLQCHQINSSSSRWLQSKCWLPCPKLALNSSPIRASFGNTVLQAGGTWLWKACLHNHIFLSSVSSHYSVLSTPLWSLWVPQPPHLQKIKLSSFHQVIICGRSLWKTVKQDSKTQGLLRPPG